MIDVYIFLEKITYMCMFVCKNHLTNYIHGTFVCTNMAYTRFDWWLYDKNIKNILKSGAYFMYAVFHISTHFMVSFRVCVGDSIT